MNYTLQNGDCRTLLKSHKPNTFTACVTDPPYGLKDIKGSKTWDGTGISFQWKTWRPIYRVLKPGAYCLAFGHPRTYHRLAVALEDAGFEVCDCLLWLHAQGLPKSRSIPKELMRSLPPLDYATLYERWQGWGTNLRPAWEPIVVARKPMADGYARNILEHGVGGLNIAACSIPCEPGDKGDWQPEKSGRSRRESSLYPKLVRMPTKHDTGRHPANVLIDGVAALMLDNSTRTSSIEKGRKQYTNRTLPHVMHRLMYDYKMPIFGSKDGYEVNPVSRFFYCMRANKKDRGPNNHHPTVKPTPLMKYLLSLVTYPEQNYILDPFCGSGSTLVAAARLANEGADIRMVGMDTDATYLALTQRRVSSLKGSRYDTTSCSH